MEEIPMSSIIETIILVVEFVAGIIENICVIIVIIANKTLHNTVDYYLFSLAISDIFYVTCFPLEMLSIIWSVLDSPALYNYIAIVGSTGVDTSALTVLLFAVERYLAICHPFSALQLSSKKKQVIMMIISIWILSLISNLLWLWEDYKNVRIQDAELRICK